VLTGSNVCVKSRARKEGVMSIKKRHLIFAGHNSTILNLFSGAVSNQIGLEVYTYSIDDYGHLNESLPEHINVDAVVFFTEAGLEATKAEEIYKFWRKNFSTTDFIWCHGGVKSEGDWNFRELVVMKGWRKLLSIDTDLLDVGGLYTYFVDRLNKIADS
jgi:hypothetical protein